MKYILKFDGACKGNPGVSGGGAIIYRESSTGNEEVIRCGVFLPSATNNQAEYAGLITGLKHAKFIGVKHLTIIGDSQLIVKQLNGKYAVRSQNIIKYYSEAKKLLQSFESVTVEHVLRTFNADADAVANHVVACRADLCVSNPCAFQGECMACPKT